MPRFTYPVRPIFFMAICYLAISTIYIIGFVTEQEVSCINNPATIQGPRLVAQGTSPISCTLMAMVYYFFNIASSIW